MRSSFRIPFIKPKSKLTYSLTSELFIREPVKAKGKLTCTDDIHVDTAFQGSIRSEGHLTIGPNASLKGSAHARSIHHQGKLDGSLYAKSTIILHSGSKMQQGQVKSEKIEIQPGSELKDVIVTTIQA